MRRILLIARSFPPINEAGTARPFFFAKYLPAFGYQPHVISTANTDGYAVDPSWLERLPAEVTVDYVGRSLERLPLGAFQRRLPSPLGKAVQPAARLERSWHGWVGPVVRRGLALATRHRFDLVWATGPPWDTLRAGYLLSKLLRRPFVADLRDPWTYGPMWHLITPARQPRELKRERQILTHATRTVFTSPLTTAAMQARYPAEVADRFVTITNGFDGEAPAEPERATPDNRFVLRHLGALHPQHRRPEIVLDGLRLAMRDETLKRDVYLEFVGTLAGMDALLQADDLADHVTHRPPVPFARSRALMRGADALVMLQNITGEGRDVIAGKLFEYLAAERPILGIVPPDGGDAWLLRETGAGNVTGITDPRAVADAIRALWQRWQAGTLTGAVDPAAVTQYARHALAGRLAALFDEILAAPTGAATRTERPANETPR